MNRILTWFLIALLFAMSGPLQAASMASRPGFRKSLYGRFAPWADKYAYCGGDPINASDPSGLDQAPPGYSPTAFYSGRLERFDGMPPGQFAEMMGYGLFYTFAAIEFVEFAAPAAAYSWSRWGSRGPASPTGNLVNAAEEEASFGTSTSTDYRETFLRQIPRLGGELWSITP